MTVLNQGNEVGMVIGNPKQLRSVDAQGVLGSRQMISLPIASLKFNPFQGGWIICARVTSKPPLRTYYKSGRLGHIMYVDLADKSVS